MVSAKIKRIPLGRLVPHPGCPNRMSRATAALARLARSFLDQGAR